MTSKWGSRKTLFVLAIFPPIFYAWYTQHIWEDFFITLRHSQNLALGNGLVFNPEGERMHGFTSPLGVLLPAFFYYITGKSSYLITLWCFRIFSAFAFAGAAVFLYKLAKEKAGFYFGAVLLYLFFILDIKAMAFSSNGMETALMLFFVVWTLYNLQGETSKNITAGGVSFAGLMWTRPDGCLYIAAMGLSSLLFFENRKERFINLFKMGLLCAVLYLPWFLWAYWYFGSPIPQPVQAKSAIFELSLITNGKIFPLIMEKAELIFYPIYVQFGGWPWWLGYVIRPQVLFCLFYWVIPSKNTLGRQTSFCFLLFSYYFTGIYAYPWYLPAVAIFGWITLATGAETFYLQLKSKIGKFSIVPLALALCLLAFNILYIGWGTAVSMKIQMAEIEMGTRKEIGLWLKENVAPKETIYTECIGYLGYFSERILLDFPGLVTPRVAEIKKKKNLSMIEIIPEMEPDWLALRGREADSASFGEYFKNHYEAKKTFDATERLNKLAPFPGKGYSDLDALFTIYHKKK